MKYFDKLQKASAFIKSVGLEKYLKKPVHELSGGEKQRVAIARALVADPKYILADEPTGSIDSSTSKEIIDMLLRINKKGKTLILVTHDISIARQCGRQIEICDGTIKEDIVLNNP